MFSRDLDSLIDLAARLGSDPLLTHAFTGNVSIKIDDVLWIKASGTSLADARRRQILVPVDRNAIASCVLSNDEHGLRERLSSGERLKPSIETPLHAALRQRVVVHVHSVNSIACAVRADGKEWLASSLAGLRWKWIRYVSSGLPLAREIARSARSGSDVFVLANHGLVVCGESCAAVEALLHTVERRLAVPARDLTAPDHSRLKYLIDEPGWSPACDPAVHSLSTDPCSRRMAAGGVLYPCHALFLKPSLTVFGPATRVSDAARAHLRAHGSRPRFLLVKDAGVLTHERLTSDEREMLIALAEVVRRIPEDAPIRWLTATEIATVEKEGEAYRRHEAMQELYEAATLTAPELDRLYNAAVAERNHRHVAIFTLVCACGMTAEEVTKLRVSDVDVGRLGTCEAEAITPWLRKVADRDDAFFANGSRRPISMNELSSLIRYYGAIAGIPIEKRRATAIVPLQRTAAAG